MNVIDRDGRARTGRYDRMMRPLPPAPERDSIYGNPYGGVPNPLVPVEHGYPTRFHGPIWTQPMPSYEYQPRPYTRMPFLGVEGLGGMAPSITGNTAADAVIGTLVGYLGAPSREQALVYAIAGALAAGFAGSLGLIGLLGVALYQSQQKGNLRQELRA